MGHTIEDFVIGIVEPNKGKARPQQPKGT
jgi:hypothetical protein